MSHRDREREAEFIANWNECVNYRIDEHNLRQPNFIFFYSALESLLKSLNYDINRVKSEFSGLDAERLYYIQFCAYIDSVYQFSGPQNNFYYFDLLNPVPKKCFHVLKTLLNYLIYSDMVKKEVYTNATEFLTAYDDALEENTELLKKIKEIETRAAEVRYQLSEYEQALQNLQQEVSQLNTQKEQNEKCVRELNDAIKELERVIIKTDIKYAEVAENIITEDEYKMKLNQLKGIADHARESNVTSNAQVDGLSKIIDSICTILQTQKLSVYEELIDSQNELASVNNQITSTEQKNNELTANIQSLAHDIEQILAQIKQKDIQLNNLQKNFEEQQNKLKRSNDTRRKEIADAKADPLLLQAVVEDLEEQQLFLMHSITQIAQRSARSNKRGL